MRIVVYGYAERLKKTPKILARRRLLYVALFDIFPVKSHLNVVFPAPRIATAQVNPQTNIAEDLFITIMSMIEEHQLGMIGLAIVLNALIIVDIRRDHILTMTIIP